MLLHRRKNNIDLVLFYNSDDISDLKWVVLSVENRHAIMCQIAFETERGSKIHIDNGQFKRLFSTMNSDNSELGNLLFHDAA